MIERLHDLYQKHDFISRAASFDGPDGNFTQNLIREFNGGPIRVNSHEQIHYWPHQIVILKRTKLPFSYPCSDETARIFRDALAEWGRGRIEIFVVQSAEELAAKVGRNPHGSLVISQTADQSVYNYEKSLEFEKKSVAVVPGPLTAPGHYFSDKTWLYQALYNVNLNYDYIAPYGVVDTIQKDPEILAEKIIQTAEQYQTEWKTSEFFVKPYRHGGGSKGGFWLSCVDDKFLIPTLTYLTGQESDEYQPNYIKLDPDNDAQIAELVWIFRQFEQNSQARERLLTIDLLQLRKRYQVPSDHEAVRLHILNTNKRFDRFRRYYAESRADVITKLAQAITRFQGQTGVHYEPMICRKLNMGHWTLRAHVRSSGPDIIVESLYARLFPIALMEDGIAYRGTDSLNPMLTGHYEGYRQKPLNSILIDSIGGPKKFFRGLDNAVLACRRMMKFLPEEKRPLIPVRAEFDIAPVESKIIESNADGVLGFSLGTRWSDFVQHTRAWLSDSLHYYAWFHGDRDRPPVDFEF